MARKRIRGGKVRVLNTDEVDEVDVSLLGPSNNPGSYSHSIPSVVALGFEVGGRRLELWVDTERLIGALLGTSTHREERQNADLILRAVKEA